MKRSFDNDHEEQGSETEIVAEKPKASYDDKKPVSETVKIKNFFYGIIELDLGRDKEISFFPGEEKIVEKSVTESEQFKAASKFLKVIS